MRWRLRTNQNNAFHNGRVQPWTKDINRQLRTVTYWRVIPRGDVSWFPVAYAQNEDRFSYCLTHAAVVQRASYSFYVIFTCRREFLKGLQKSFPRSQWKKLAFIRRGKTFGSWNFGQDFHSLLLSRQKEISFKSQSRISIKCHRTFHLFFFSIIFRYTVIRFETNNSFSP